MKESKAIRKFAMGAVVRAGIEGAKYLSKKMAKRSAKKAAQEKTTDGVGEIAAMGLGGGAAAAAVSRLQLEQIAEKRALAEREQIAEKRALAERERDKAPARTEFENLRRGGSVSSASKRADGCAVKGKTKGRFV